MENQRTAKKAKDKLKVDLTKPIDKAKFISAEDDCFTKEWDMGTTECKSCSDNEVCGILYRDLLKKKTAAREKEDGEYLDKSDLRTLNESQYSVWCTLKERTTEELFDKIQADSNCADEEAVVLFIKRFFLKEGFHAKKGVIYAND